MTRTFFSILLFVCFFFAFPESLISQDKDDHYTIEDVLNLESSYYDDLKEGGKHKWTAKDGYTYRINKTSDTKATYIEFDGDFVRHGTYYRYSSNTGKNKFRYLQESTDYVYGKKHGVSKFYLTHDDSVYLNEVSHYNYGLRHGEFIVYNNNGDIKRNGEYSHGIKSGLWTINYDNGAVMYEFKYDGFDAIREEYDIPVEEPKKGKKGRLTSITPYQYYVEYSRGKWVKHGIANIVDYDGKNKERYYYLGKRVDNWQDNPDSYTEYYNSNQACARGAAEIRALQQAMKSTSKQAKAIKQIAGDFCVYLVEYTPKEETWYPTINSLRMKLTELTKREATDKDVKLVLDFRTSVTMGVRN